MVYRAECVTSEVVDLPMASPTQSNDVGLVTEASLSSYVMGYDCVIFCGTYKTTDYPRSAEVAAVLEVSRVFVVGLGDRAKVSHVLSMPQWLYANIATVRLPQTRANL